MPLKAFNDAMEAARTAYTAGDEEAFMCAVTAARHVVEAHPALCQMLSHAMEAFPDIEALRQISLVCLEFGAGAG